MSNTLPERPVFTDGQYIGAADLNAAVGYARDETRRLALSGSAWGIATGLALIEIPDTTGGVQLFIEPGIAWDGYGRPVVVLAPAPVTPDLFNGLTSEPQTVWLRYVAAAVQFEAPGFQNCGAGDPATRIGESYAIEAGSPTVSQRSAGVVIGGADVADPRDMLIAVDQNAAVVLDGAAPHQSFPDDTAVWLIPVGIALYNAGTPGSFSARNEMELAQSRAVRRYLHAVAEDLLAADGVLRLRDRQTDNPNALSDDALDVAAAIQPTDLGVDPNNASRLIGNELVWVEGNLRVTGHARMFGTQLELRDSNGLTGGVGLDVPQFLRRAVQPASNPLGGQDLQVCFDRPGDTTGTNRLTFGVAVAATPDPPCSNTLDGAMTELMVVRADGRVAIGTNAIDSYNAVANNLVVASAADTGITVVSSPSNTGNLFFADGTSKTQQNDGFVAYDHSTRELTLGAGAETMLAVTPGSVIVGGADPTGFAGDTDQLIVASGNGGAGITISGASGTIGSIDFADGASAPFDAGFIRYHLTSNQMSFGTKGTPQVCITHAGQVGIGTQSPEATDPGAQLVVASSGGDAVVTISGASFCGLKFGTTGMLPVGGVSYDLSVNRMDFLTLKNKVVSINSEGFVGIGTTSPVAQLQVSTQPNAPGLIVDNGAGATALWAEAGTVAIGNAGPARTTLDVRGTVPSVSPPGSGASPAVTNHLAILENTETGTGSANVLALVVDTTLGEECRFVTFYSGTTDIGAITGAGGFLPDSVTYSTLGADYAEAVPRAENAARIGAKKIVGVRAGQVSLATEGADAVFVTSEAPAMLARRPHREKQDAYELLAFLGQVNVPVEGPVRSGDLIVASGKADGMGRAVPLEEVQPEDLPMIVGRAWESVDDASKSGVNAVVGPGVATAAAAGVLLARQAREIERLAAQLAERKPAGAD